MLGTAGMSNSLANDAWESLLGAHAALMKSFVAEDIWDEVSIREYDVLYSLSKGQPMSITELNRRVLLSQPALSRLVERLVTRGLVQRQTNERDGRSVQLSLTQAGAESQRKIGRIHARQVVRAMAALDDRELQTLQSICTKLRAANMERGDND